MDQSSRMNGPGGAGNENGMPLPPSPYIGRLGYPGANGFPYGGSPMGTSATAADPQQQRLLQLQIRQQQLQLQQLQAQTQQQQHRRSPPHPSPPSHQPQYSSQLQQQYAPPMQHQQHQQQQRPSSSPQPTLGSTSSPSPAQKKVIPKPPSDELVAQWVSQCDWRDKTIYAARQLLGGSTVNGFLRSTASVQRVKKQRARQVALAKRNAMRAAGDLNPAQEPTPSEDELKVSTMNPRTAKKIQSELQQGIQFVKTLHGTIQSIIKELDPTGMSLPPPIEKPVTSNTAVSNVQAQMDATMLPTFTSTTKTNSVTSSSATSSPGDPQGSTFRKSRKRKLSMPDPDLNLLEYDATGKRLFTKKEHSFRIAEVLRFRALRAGEYVAARVSSRDLWILARVVRDYPAVNMDPAEFLKLTPAKRDLLFRDKVVVKDAEEKGSDEPIFVARQLILPLPRSYGEAAEWGTRLKKGSRIYAMYPNTTALYVANVVDNTTYCRGDDDIIVVEFDEDEKDASGALPKWHIPARFTTLIPREFPASQTTAKRKRSSSSGPTVKQASKKSTATHPRIESSVSTDAALNAMVNDMTYGFGTGGLDFDPLVDFSAGNNGAGGSQGRGSYNM